MSKSVKLFIVAAVLFIISAFAGIIVNANVQKQKEEQKIEAEHRKIEQELAEKAEQEEKERKEKKAEEDALYKPAEELFIEKNYTEAIKKCDEIIETNPDFNKPYNLKGICMVYNGDYLNGMPLIEKSLEMDPKYPFAIYCKAAALDEYAHYDEALEWYLKHLEYGDYLLSDYRVAAIYASKNDVDNSLKYLEIAINLDNNVKNVAKNSIDFNNLKDNEEFKLKTEE